MRHQCFSNGFRATIVVRGELFQFGVVIGITTGLGFEKALTLLIANGITWSRNHGDSRVESDSSISGASKRNAQMVWTNCRSSMIDAGSTPPVHGRRRGKEIE